MKRYLFVLLVIFVGLPLSAQNKKTTTPKSDVIITVQSEKIDAIITEVSDETVSYKKASNPKGPTYTLSTDKISTILYANGEVQVVKHKAGNSSSTSNTQETVATATPARTATTSQTVHSPAPPFMVNNSPIINTRETKPVESETAPKDKTPYLSGTGHIRGMVGGFGSGQKVNGGIGGDVEFGFVAGGDINFLGAGIALDALFGKMGDETITTLYMPIYACDRLYFSSAPLAPYLDLSLGGFVNLKQEMGFQSEKLKGGGLYFRPGLGVAIEAGSGTFVHLNVGYELRYAKVQGYELTAHAIYFRIGFGGR